MHSTAVASCIAVIFVISMAARYIRACWALMIVVEPTTSDATWFIDGGDQSGHLGTIIVCDVAIACRKTEGPKERYHPVPESTCMYTGTTHAMACIVR